MKSDDNYKIINDDKNLNTKSISDISCALKMTSLVNNNTDELFNNLDTFNNKENSSRMQSILEEFTNLYTAKISRINDMEEQDEEWLKKKTSVLESWVEDLGEQNCILVSTVEQLEKEAGHRVCLLQEKLEKMALVTKESCVSLRDHQLQVDNLVTQKIKAEESAQDLRDQIISLERTNTSLLQENSDLKDDLESLIAVIASARTKGKWNLDRVSFKHVVPSALFGSESSLSFKNLSSLRHSADGRKSSKVSLSSIGSPGSTDTEDDSSGRLRSEYKALRRTHKQTNILLVERDKHIADLQSQITELHHKLAFTQSHVDTTTTTLQSLRDRGRYDTLEICRRDDMIRQLLSPKHAGDHELTTLIDDDFDPAKKTDLEMQLSNNIDVLASRLVDLDEECQKLRHQNDVYKTAHSHCTPIINQLQEQLSKSHKSTQDLRSMLTAEVAERHDQIILLRNQLHEARELRQESLDELQLKDETIKKLRELSSFNDTMFKPFAKDQEMKSPSKEYSVQCTQTDNDKFDISDHYKTEEIILDLNSKISKLENELTEKNILVRELQTHLSTSRKELYLKDETLYNVEHKLDITRRGCDEKEDRMIYLTSQLTSLQLEVSRLHGTVQQLRLQLDSKLSLVKKLEVENESLCWQLNEKSSTLEKLQKEIASYEQETEKRKKEIREQKLTIGTLQDALVSTKQTCDKLRKQYDLETEVKMEISEQTLKREHDHSEDDKIIHHLRSKLEEAKTEGKVLAEKCRKMEKVHDAEFRKFVDELIHVQNHRLRTLKDTLCTCKTYRNYPDDSQIAELVVLMEELISILQDAQMKTFETKREERVQNRSRSRELSQYSNYSKNNKSSMLIANESCGSLTNFAIGCLEKGAFKSSLDQILERRNSSSAQNVAMAEKLKKFTTEKSDFKEYNELRDDEGLVSSVSYWLQRQKPSDSKPIEKQTFQQELRSSATRNENLADYQTSSDWKLTRCRGCPTRYCSCENLHRGCLDDDIERDGHFTRKIKPFLDQPKGNSRQASHDDREQTSLLRTCFTEKNSRSNYSRTSERNSSCRRHSLLRTFDETKLGSIEYLINELEHITNPDRQQTN